MKNYISFPGLGIDEFSVSEVAFTLFGREVAWYGVIITVGILLAVLYVIGRSKQEGIKEDDILDFAIFVIPLSVFGARLFYVLTRLEEYKSIRDAIAIWEGGLAIYGAVITGALVILSICLVKKINILKMFDIACPAVMIGQIIGRWGNFVNAEAFGRQTDIFIRMGIRSEWNSVATYVHPTFLYESMWNLFWFLLINAYYKKKKYHGEIFFMYITTYGIGRFFIEGLRTDSLYVGNFRISQVIGIVSFVVGLTFLLLNYFKKARGAEPILEKEGTVVPKVIKEVNGKKKDEEKTEEDENGEDN